MLLVVEVSAVIRSHTVSETRPLLMWTDEARIRPETQHLWARHGSVSTVFEKGLLAFSAKKCVKCKDAARRAEPVAAKPEEKVQKSLSSLSWRTKWFSTPTQHFHLFL